MSTRSSLSFSNEQADAGRYCRRGLAIKFSRPRAGLDTEIFVSPVQLTTSRIGNFTRFTHTLLYICDGRTCICSFGDFRISATVLVALLSSLVSSTNEGPRI